MPDRRSVIGAALLGAALLAISAGSGSAQELLDIGIAGSDIGMSALDFDAARASFFYQNDQDGNFALSFDEMSNALVHGGGRLFDGYDSDGDGLISFDEYVHSGLDIFRSLDLDGDGMLSGSEM